MKEEIEKKYEGKSLSQAAKAMQDLKAKIANKDAEVKELKAEYEMLRKNILVRKLDDIGASSINIKGVGRVTLRTDAYVSTVSEKKEDLFEWFRSHGFDELITETVNASTLKAFYKEQFNEGNEVPPSDLVRFDPYDMVSITKT